MKKLSGCLPHRWLIKSKLLGGINHFVGAHRNPLRKQIFDLLVEFVELVEHLVLTVIEFFNQRKAKSTGHSKGGEKGGESIPRRRMLADDGVFRIVRLSNRQPI